MYKSMLDIFNQQQMQVLRRKMWWVAQSYKPFLVKFATDGDFALLELTDLRSLWVARIHNKTLEEDKDKYAKTLEVTDKKGLMNLFESLLTATDPDPKTIYSFKETQSSEMQFTFKKKIKFFDFNWTFKLKKVNCNPVQLVCKELLTPLSSALQAQTNRLQKLKKRFEHVEKDYVRKMTQMQKSLYRSPLLIDDQQEWQQLLPKYSQKLLQIHTPDKFSQFCFQNFVEVQKNQNPEQLLIKSQQKIKVANLIPMEDHFELADDYLTEQLQKERQKQKKERKIDFI